MHLIEINFYLMYHIEIVVNFVFHIFSKVVFGI